MATTDIQQSTNSRLPSTLVTPTLAGNKIQIAALTKQNVNIDQYTTLNEVLGIQSALSLGSKAGSDFTLQYSAIGLKGSQYLGSDSNGLVKMVVNQHQPTDTNMFYMIPQIIRELSNDLSATERANYRLRLIQTINGVQYVMYYLKLIDFTNFVPTTRKVTHDATTGVDVPDVYIPQEDGQHPTPLVPNSDGVVPVSDQYVTASGKMDISLDATAIAELQNVCRILLGDASKAAVNEYAIVTGIDTQVDGNTSGSTTIRYTEAISATIAYQITETWPRDTNANGEIPLGFDIGASSPLLLTSS